MSTTEFKVLEQLLGGYFHQDWVDEFETEAFVLQTIVQLEPKEKIESGAMEIQRLLAMSLSEVDLKALIVEQIGCYFDPTSEKKTYRHWLGLILERFLLE
jgi:hypothetical protein